MVWRTNTVVIDCYDKLGPHRLTPPPTGVTRQYILDGVQRLSTLYGALHRPAPTASSPTEDLIEGSISDPGDSEEPDEVGLFDVFYDPEREDFVSPGDVGDISGPLMPVSLVFDSLALLRYQRKLADAGVENAIKSTDQLARAFRDYKLPVIPITTDDINLATRTFQRINSQGARMSEAHMVHALTWNPGFDLQNRLSDHKEQMLAERGWGSLDNDPILKACKAAFGLDVYKASADELSTALVNNPDVLGEIFESIARVADFLWVECGVGSPDLVPYALQIVVLAEAFRVNPAPSKRTKELLYGWLWVTTYGELFAGMSGDRVQLAISDMHETVNGDTGKWTWKRPFEERPLRPTFDFRAARAKAFAFRLAALQDAVLGERVGTRVLADSARKALAQVIPWKAAGKVAYSSPGNRFLVAPAEVHDFREALGSGTLTSKEKQAHGISNEADRKLQAGDIEGFVRQRTADIVSAEHAFLLPLLSEFLGDAAIFSTGPRDPIDTILSLHNVKLVSRVDDSEFVITLGALLTPITIEITPKGEYWGFLVSHAIHTPLQAGPYWTSRPFDDTPQDALRRAITGLESYYNQAVSHGYTPSENWLVLPNV